jgi:hypothetical protein
VNQDPDQSPSPSLWQTIVSVAAAFFGVQSSKNRRRDFSRGKASHFIIMGVVMTIVFITTLVVIVKLVLHHAGL